MIKIKAKTTKEQKKWIEEQLSHYENALIRAKEEYEKEISRINEAIQEYKDFWAKNDMLIYDWQKERDRVESIPHYKLFKVNQKWVKTGKININVLKEDERWGCEHCGRETVNRYITNGDPRYDETEHYCDCAGAKKNGEKWSDE